MHACTQATVRGTRAGALSAPDAQLFQAAVQQHRSLDWLDYVSVDVGAAHPHLLAAAGTGGQ